MRTILALVTAIGACTPCASQVTMIRTQFPNSPWLCDSAYAGAGFIVRDSAKDVQVIWVSTLSTARHGSLYLIEPEYPAILFYNDTANYPTYPKQVNVGKYPAGTRLVFMYTVQSCDVNVFCDPRVVGKRIYSGQNRIGIDTYVSERNRLWEYRWFAAGAIDDSTVQGAVEDSWADSFIALYFKVTNAYLEVVSKLVCPSPQVSARGSSSADTMTLSVLHSGDCIVYPMEGDTVWRKTIADTFRIFYTLDNSDPRNPLYSTLYTQPIVITQPCTLKTFTTLEGPSSPDWFPSGVVSYACTLPPTRSRWVVAAPDRLSRRDRAYVYYTIDGRAIRFAHSNRPPKTAIVLAVPMGMDTEARRLTVNDKR